MTQFAPHQHYTVREYLQLEEFSNVRHEYYQGQVYAMGGGSPEHAARAANVIAMLVAQLGDRPCRVQTSDARVRVQATGLDTYPDVSVVCGPAELDSEDRHAIVNPIVLVEVLSPGTEVYDRGEKLEQYKRIDALREVLLVAHDDTRLDLIRRQADGTWVSIRAGVGETLDLEPIHCRVDVDGVYRDPLAGL